MYSWSSAPSIKYSWGYAPSDAWHNWKPTNKKAPDNHQKENIAYVPLDPVADNLYIADLNTRLRVGWKTLPKLNFKLKFQT